MVDYGQHPLHGLQGFSVRLWFVQWLYEEGEDWMVLQTSETFLSGGQRRQEEEDLWRESNDGKFREDGRDRNFDGETSSQTRTARFLITDRDPGNVA